MVKRIQKVLYAAGFPCGMIDGIFGQLTEEAVKAYQKANGMKVDGIVGPGTLAKMGIGEDQKTFSLKKSRRVINEIIVHCTATPEGREVQMSEIRKWHKDRGFSDVGYHYVIHLDGRIEIGRDVDISGAHCTGHNAHSVGVCYVGGLAKDCKTPKDTRTAAQKESLLSLLKLLRATYPLAKIRGHRDFAAKACPSFDATKEYKSI